MSWKRLALCPPPAELITKGAGFRPTEVDRSGTPSQMDFRSSTQGVAVPAKPMIP
jgi:hypothetical protein